ncbi:hypothetical protein BB561_001792 [Smittium simulii]|uniref:SGNH hydrolase-type esterase domain-containing protein n=1 Tax=Smittium simulii TaxID=133385 RepID=A0A2T9YT13_9FUNG|nr:hypothetical protein BB561_001792 [Smittium simulii]
MLSKKSFFSLLFAASYTISAASKPHLVVFGNSLSDLNNKDQTTNPVPLWHGRYADGPVWNEYLAHFNNYTLINYAIGGATTNNTSVKKFTNQTIPILSVLDQIANFTQVFGGKFKNGTMDNDIVIIEIGANDVFYALDFIVNNTMSMIEYSDIVVDNIIQSVDMVSKLGYKNILVTTVPDPKNSPYILFYPPPGPDNVSKYVENMNQKLTSSINSEAAKPNKSGIKLVELDKIFGLVSDPIGKALNITVVDKECYVINNNTLTSSCENSNTYAFIDLYHPNTKVHSFFGSAFAEILTNSTFTLNAETANSLIAKYNLSNANSRDNFLYNSDSYKTGITKVNSYNIKEASKNSKSIIDTKNKSVKPGVPSSSNLNATNLYFIMLQLFFFAIYFKYQC